MLTLIRKFWPGKPRAEKKPNVLQSCLSFIRNRNLINNQSHNRKTGCNEKTVPTVDACRIISTDPLLLVEIKDDVLVAPTAHQLDSEIISDEEIGGVPFLTAVLEEEFNDSKPFGVQSISYRFDFLTKVGDKDDFARKYYVSEQILGEGSSAAVCKGMTQSSPFLSVAFKSINKSKLTKDFHWGLVRGVPYPLEYCMLIKLEGIEGVNKVLDAFDDDDNDKFILALETSDDCWSLEDWILEYGAIEEIDAKYIFQHLIKAFDGIHKSGVYHRDIKSANILIDCDFNPQIIDFGLADLVENSPFSQVCGSDSYMAPEIFEANPGKKYDGLPAAVFSLGVVLDDMVTGRIGRIDYPGQELPQISEPCLDLIKKMLANRPEDRPVSLDEILEHSWMF